MKKAKTGSTPAAKISFGKRREGKHRKTSGPKAGNQKKYKGQGR
jgi:hypothetical protein